MSVYAAVGLLHSRISRVINRMDVLLPPPTLKILKFAEKEVKSFRNFVERLDSRSRERMNASLGRIAETVGKYTEHFVSRVLLYTLEDEGCEDVIGSEIHSLVEELNKVQKEYYALPQDEEEVASSSSLLPSSSKSKIVGLYDQRRILKNDLILPVDHGLAYSVVGMAGIGKTTLAREVFEDLDISEWYDCLAWVTAGTEWIARNESKSKEITEAILAQVDPEAHKITMMKGGSVEEICEGLKQSLKGKRYLIVLDDVWHASVHEYLLSSFPDNQNGSNVLITTRIKIVGQSDHGSNLIDLRLLDKQESWNLLSEKVSCPPHLEEAGKKIAEKCDGLPLTIVTVADLLSNAPESLWVDVAAKRKHQLFVDAYDQISHVLMPSYNLLSDKVRFCFLYMGAFPLKCEIPKSKLINLWIAEDFVQLISDEYNTLDFCGEFNLRLFAYFSLIMVYQRSIITSFEDPCDYLVKICGLHSSWWHFCQTKARETNLFHVLDCYNNKNIEEVLEGHTRLSIHNNVLFAIKHVHNSIEEICGLTACSLLCFGPYCQYMVPVCFGLKFLRRLDALNIRFYDFPLEVLKLVKLRYLALTCNGSLPPSISDLRKLEYLIVHPHLSIKPCGTLFNLPTEIWDLKRLRYLQVMGYDLPDLGETCLKKLKTLSNVTTGSCTVLHRVPKLRKLRIEIELTPDVVDPLCCFDHFSHLTKLRSLKCVIVNPEFKIGVVPPVSSFPCLPFSLKKLSLSGLGYPWEEMSKIASLPELKVLKLQCNAFQGPVWEVEKKGFQNLRALLIEDADLVNLKWAHGSFKRLMVLRIKHCYKAQVLDFGDLPKIREIEVVDSNPLVEWHVKSNALKAFYVANLFVHYSWKS